MIPLRGAAAHTATINTPNIMRTLTKQQVLSNFRELWREQVAHNPTLRGDVIAKREEFNDYVDFLNKQRHVSDKQAFNWSNPF